jgi:hypothetical protein
MVEIAVELWFMCVSISMWVHVRVISEFKLHQCSLTLMDRLRAEGVWNHFRVGGVNFRMGEPRIYWIFLMWVKRLLWGRKSVGRFVSQISVVIICMAVSICRGQSRQESSRIRGAGVRDVAVRLKHLWILSTGCWVIHSVVIILLCIQGVVLIVGIGVRQTSVNLRQWPRKCIVFLTARRMIPRVRLWSPVVPRTASMEALRVGGS